MGGGGGRQVCICRQHFLEERKGGERTGGKWIPVKVVPYIYFVL